MIIERQQNEDQRKYVYDKLVEYNAKHMPQSVASNFEQINLMLLDDGGNVQGGILAHWIWNWMCVDILWVDDKFRGHGYGSKLLDQIETMAVERKCECIQLDTYNFQAPEFYKRKGYEVCGRIEYAQGQVSRFYMVKRLAKG